ncbi:type II toxin-antitoxin system Phd/YefM family antitoxin [uncultured Sphingomonas sp.]|uniref:type II toxin-antitoxin system Phd/YefM family antitoxin n=1 Tax=uncultured Sphingomonas sp. TaxID=158754 RepID=UPI0035C9B759
MIHVSYTDLRKRLAHYMDRANDDRDAILVTRQGSDPVILLAQSEYEGLLATLHLLSSPANTQRLQDSVAALDAGEGFEVVWDDAAQAYRPK